MKYMLDSASYESPVIKEIAIETEGCVLSDSQVGATNEGIGKGGVLDF